MTAGQDPLMLALSDPGSFTPRNRDESVPHWQARAARMILRQAVADLPLHDMDCASYRQAVADVLDGAS